MTAHSLSSFDGNSARKDGKGTRFVVFAPDARAVHLTGDFNDWDPSAHPMKRQPDGAWMAQVPLNHGQHHYRFLVDGKPVLDPRAEAVGRDHVGAKVSVIAVS